MSRYTFKSILWKLQESLRIRFERVYWYKRINSHPTSRISIRAHIINGSKIFLDANTRIFSHAVLNCSQSPFSYRANINPHQLGSICIGEKTTIRSFACLYTYSGDIIIGKNCSINPFVIIYGHGGVHIGDHVRIATHTVLVASEHNFDNPAVPITKQGIQSSGIWIGNDVLIGAGVRILDGVRIGDGVVLGTGAVITNNIPEYAIAAGVPARVIRMRK